MTGIDAARGIRATELGQPTADRKTDAADATSTKLVVDTRDGLKLAGRIAGGVALVAGAAIGGAMLLRGGATPGAFPSIMRREPLILAGALAGVGLLGLGGAQLI